MDVRHERTNPASPSVVVQSVSKALGLTQALECLANLPAQCKHRPKIEANLEGVLQRGLALRLCLQDIQSLLEPALSVLERRARGRLEPGLVEIVHRLLPRLTADGVM